MSWKKPTNILIDALSQDGFVDDSSLQAAIDEAKSLAKITKPISQSDVVDYSFLRAAIKKIVVRRSTRIPTTRISTLISSLPRQ